MTTTTTPAPSPTKPASVSVTTTALARLRGAAADASPKHSYQRALYVMGALLIVSGLVHGVVWLVDGGSWAGAVSWRKPLLFGVSFGLAALSLGWVQGVLPRGRVLGWLTTSLIGVGSVVEVALITGQRWRGRASHFNSAEPIDELIFTLMGAAVGLVAMGMVVLLVWAIARLRGPAPAVIATFTGLVLFLGGSAIGGDLIARGTAFEETYDRVPSEVIIGAAGSGRLAHATALHALQVLALLALLLGRSAATRQRRAQLMSIAAVGYTALVVLVGAQAYAGRSMLDLSLATGLGIAAAVALIGIPFALAVLTPDEAERLPS